MFVLLVAASLLLAGCAGPTDSVEGETTDGSDAPGEGAEDQGDDGEVPTDPDPGTEDEQPEEGDDGSASDASDTSRVGPTSEEVRDGDVRVHPLTVRSTGDNEAYAVGWVENTGDTTLSQVRLRLSFSGGGAEATTWNSVNIPIAPGEKVPFASAPVGNFDRASALEVGVNETTHGGEELGHWFTIDEHNGTETTNFFDDPIYQVKATLRNANGTGSAKATLAVLTYDDAGRLLDAGTDWTFSLDPGGSQVVEVDLENPQDTARYELFIGAQPG